MSGLYIRLKIDHFLIDLRDKFGKLIPFNLFQIYLRKVDDEFTNRKIPKEIKILFSNFGIFALIEYNLNLFT